ncbi:MAG: hypothetical protein NC417_01880 [Candidatus Gastranaerophilales bacterium]|nr:hypothetical protein [Candidatus Gastranaerophilales bacterium]
MFRYKKSLLFLGCLALCLAGICPVRAAQSEALSHQVGQAELTAEEDRDLEELILLYEAYQARFDAIESVDDIVPNGYEIIENQVFPVVMESFGEEEVRFLAAFDSSYHRMAVFLADADDRIVYKTDQLETNNRILGQLEQPTKEMAAVSFYDVNQDGLTDILLITRCVNDTGDYAGKVYKVGDVLFQGEGTFYRDWRVSDKINRFDMNKSANCIISYIRDGNSAEFLYTATTLNELLSNGFSIIEEQHYTRNFEKLGRLQVVPGVFRISEYDFFMIYLVNEQGSIVWRFQPMGDYDNLYSLRGINGRDVDGDGMKDLIVLGRYSLEGPDGSIQVESQCSIYYQRTGGFDIDMDFVNYYQCTEEDTMEGLVQKIREYWGWQMEETENTKEKTG